MPETFNVGDVVKLKSGSPRMTVTETGTDMADRPLVWVSWFAGNETKTGTFPPDSLEHAK